MKLKKIIESITGEGDDDYIKSKNVNFIAIKKVDIEEEANLERICEKLYPLEAKVSEIS